MWNLLAHIPQGAKPWVAATVRTFFAQPSRQAARAQVEQMAHLLDQHWPKAATLSYAAEPDILTYMSFLREYWTRIYSINPLERLNREVKRCTDGVPIFLNYDAALGLAGTILLRMAHEWAADECHYFSHTC
jgi:putative transposase